MQAGKGKGYERWAKVFNLKEAAKTLNFLVDNGVTDYEELAARAENIPHSTLFSQPEVRHILPKAVPLLVSAFRSGHQKLHFVSGVEFVIYRDGKYVDFFGESLSLTSARSAEGRP